MQRIKAIVPNNVEKKISIHPAGHLQMKAWGQKEFSMIDTDKNLLTFGDLVK